MSKPNFITALNAANLSLKQSNVPFEFQHESQGGHPVLFLSNGVDKTQLRKGNYSQVLTRLESELTKLIETFNKRPVTITVYGVADVSITNQYSLPSPILEHCQRVADNYGSPIKIVIEGYEFNLRPNVGKA